jgi:hypothetical protein
MNFTGILKKRSVDIVLVVTVFTVFFMSSNNQVASPEKGSDTMEPVVESVPAGLESTVMPVNESAPPAMPSPDSTPSPVRNMQIPSGNNTTPEAAAYSTPHPNPYQELRDSFKQVEGGAVSTEAIIERNTYFKKLSEQLRDLQGEVSTDSSGTATGTNEVILSDDFPNRNSTENDNIDTLLEDPELLDEILDEMELLQ